jgi:hypothetical protein
MMLRRKKNPAFESCPRRQRPSTGASNSPTVIGFAY